MRVALIHVAQETNDFNPLPTTLRDYEAFGVFEGGAIARNFSDVGQIGGHYHVANADGGVETVPLIRAWAVAGGRVTREAFEHFQERIAAGLKSAGRLDGLHLQLHGACSAEGIDDVEGEQASLCRDILGPDVPIVLGLDHHANVTRKMVGSVDAIVGHRTQPHDPFDTGVIGARLLLRVAREKLRPAMAWRKIPLLSHQEQFLTSRGPMKRWFDQARAMEADLRVLQASCYPMQPWLDVAEGGWAAIVVTDGDAALAAALADELADLCWSMRDDFQERAAIDVDSALRMAASEPKGVVVLSDTGDTVFGGAAGDSNVILESLLRQNIDRTTLIPMIAPLAARRLADAGAGARVTLPIGGETATRFFTPIEVTGTVRRVGGGRIAIADQHQREIDMGLTVVLDVGPATLLVSELRGLAGNLPEIWRAFGIEPSRHHMAVVKTASNFQYFQPIASRVIRCDTRGPGQSDVFTLPWRRLPRPIYPLERFADRRLGSGAITSSKEEVATS